MLAKEMVKQSLPLLILCGIGAIIAGSTLSLMTGLFEKIPGFIIAIPAVIAMRGNISTAFGSRLGSAYHLGVINEKNLFNEELKQNILGSIILSFLMSFLIGILSFIGSFILGFFPNPLLIILIVLIAGVISGLILSILTIGIIYLVFKRGYDPDNITGPALATFGDIITLLCVFGSAIFVGVFI